VRDDFLAQRRGRLQPGSLVRVEDGGHEPIAEVCLDLLLQLGVLGGRDELALRLAGHCLKLALQLDDPPDFLVREENGLDEPLLGDLVRLPLDHHHGVIGTGDHQIQPALEELPARRVDHQLAIDLPHADRPYRARTRGCRRASALPRRR
jgi:hypothetical protein